MVSNGFAPEKRSKLILEKKSGPSWCIERRTLNKFLLDKPFYEDEDFLLLVEGVVLNRKEIERQYHTGNFPEAILKAYKAKGEIYFNDFRGSFSGLLYDKQKKLWLIFTDHIGDKQVLYTQHKDDFIFGSEPGFVFEYCKRNALPLTLDEEAAYMILTYGFFIENHTLAREIKKLTAGHYLRIQDGKVEEVQYHRFRNEPDPSRTLGEWIEGIDHHFRNAIKLEFDKDMEYGYKHITTLSGGLDSRMTIWVAHEMGYTEQLNTTFSQSNYLDETIAKQVATDLKHEWIFKALDHGNFLKNIDEITRITYGGAAYYGLAHGKSMYDIIDFEPYGIAHTGQIGDAIIGTFYKKPIAGTPYNIGDGAYSTTLIERLKDYKFIYNYDNIEIFSLYTRAFTGANQGLLVFQEHTESVSPFTDVDFLQCCYTIPVELRFRHKIYFDWIVVKYPEAANYLWERTRNHIKPSFQDNTINIFGKKIQKDKMSEWMIGAIKRRLPFRKEKKPVNPLASKYHMNPFDYWYQTNSDVREFLDTYMAQHLDLLPTINLKNDCWELYQKGSVAIKTQVLTLLSANKLITS